MRARAGMSDFVSLLVPALEPEHELFLVYGKGRPGIIRGMDMGAKVPDEHMIDQRHGKPTPREGTAANRGGKQTWPATAVPMRTQSWRSMSEKPETHWTSPGGESGGGLGAVKATAQTGHREQPQRPRSTAGGTPLRLHAPAPTGRGQRRSRGVGRGKDNRLHRWLPRAPPSPRPYLRQQGPPPAQTQPAGP